MDKEKKDQLVLWMNKKKSNFENIQKLLAESYETGHMTNNGPLVTQLEMFFSCLLNIDTNRCVIAATNGALALHTLINGLKMYYNKPLRFATQDFTFPCAIQGPLQGSHIIDLDPNTLTLDLDALMEVPSDGILVTNLFGNVGPLDKISKWAEDNSKILIFDNATVTSTEFLIENKEGSDESSDSDSDSNQTKHINVNNFGDGCIVSLHHTKPLGFGEGGLIITKKKYEASVRNCLNFGFSNKNSLLREGHPLGNNGKMSDIAAAFILDYVTHYFTSITVHTKNLIKLFEKKLSTSKVRLFPNCGKNPSLSCFPLIFDQAVTEKEIIMFESQGITAKKYYTPLKGLPVSKDLYSRILCLPLHLDVDEDILDRYISIIKDILTNYG